MPETANNQATTKKWNVGLKVSPEEEQKIKMKALEKGMRISEYIKQAVLDSLSGSKISTEGKLG